MKNHLIFSIIGVLAGGPAFAQTSVQTVPPSPVITTTPNATIVTMPGETVTTTVQSPNSTTTTKVTTSGGHSVMGKLKDGTRLEMDSDGSVYHVYSDGARVSAEDGIHTLLDGSAVTVKDGKRIP